MDKERAVIKTSFQLPLEFHRRLKLMCHLTGKTMGEFIRISLRDKIDSLKVNEK